MIAVPELSLVVLVGISGSGKSTFARRHFAPTQVLSSDAFRGMVADDENDQSASADAFDALHYVAGKRLRAGRLTVVDATNVQPHARAGLVALAREHDVLPVAIVLDVPEERVLGAHPGAAGPHVRPPGPDPPAPRPAPFAGPAGPGGVPQGPRPARPGEVDDAVIRYEKLFNDRKELTGPFDIIGDVHGCRAELETLLTRLG